MRSAFTSINSLGKKMRADMRAERSEILKHSLPPCFKEFDNCDKGCSVWQQCSDSTVVIDEGALRRLGF